MSTRRPAAPGDRVARVAGLGIDPFRALFAGHRLAVSAVAEGASIPGSFWGEPEAGLVGATLYLRPDTPVHSALHEGSHYLCMDTGRRRALHTDAGGDDLEECAVCYLQIVLAGALPGVTPVGLMRDMDRWGYSFRLGSARAWFEHDAGDARAWLRARGGATHGRARTPARQRAQDVEGPRRDAGHAHA